MSKPLFSQAYTFDWGSSFSPAWSNGATTRTATNINGSGVNATVTVTLTGTGAAWSSTTYPSVNSNNSSSSLFEVQGSTDAIEYFVDFANKASLVRTTITFSSPIQNFTFGIADLDGDASSFGGSSSNGALGYLDSVSITGTSPSGATVIPAVSKYNAASTLINIDASNAASANPSDGQNASSTAQGTPSQNGTVFVTFTGNAVTTITIDWTTKNHRFVASDPADEAIAIGNIKFDKSIAPVTSAVTNSVIANAAGQTAISGLAGTDDESVSTFSIVSLPPAASGVLYYYNGTSYVAVTAGQTLTLSQAASLKFDPASTYTGNASFTYTCTDNRALGSNTSTFVIPVEPTPLPTANNITAAVMNNSNGQTAIPALQAAVSSGAIASYVIATIPPASQGVLYLCNSTCNPVTAGQSVHPADIEKLQFDPAPTYTGSVGFTYTAVSNTGAVSNTANYTIPVNNQPPAANPILSQVFNNAWGQTGIPPLSGADVDGTISAYTVSTIPAASQGVLYYYNGSSYIAVTAGQNLTPSQAATLKFDPAPGYTGNASFTYTATDNSGNVSPFAGYTIPVKGPSSVNLPPYSDNIVAPPISNASPATLLPNLVAHDPDGSIASYTVATIPTATQGTLTYCSNSAEPCTGTVTTITAGTTLTPAQMATLKFAPNNGYTGTVNFTYSAKDNSNNGSNTANYTIPVVNTPPVANPIVTPTITNTTVQSVLPPLSGFDQNTVSSYTISAIPAASQGVLYLCNTACNPVTAGQVINPADIDKLKFTPASGFTGNAAFNYTATDNNGAVSNVAPYTIPVTNGTIPTGVPPVAYNKTATAIANTAPATALTGLGATDADGTIANYTINSIPPVTEGILTLCNPTCLPVLPGQVIGVSDAANLKFTPTLGYTGNAVFDYTATDNSGKISNVATYTIPVTGVPPVSKNIQALPMAVTGAQLPISSLSSTDADGTVVKYVVNSLPPSSSGALYLCAVVCSPVTVGQALTPAQAALLQFQPAAGFVGIYSQFNYSAVDNNGNISNVATYTIPLYAGNLLPVTLIQFGARKQANETAMVTWTSENEARLKNYVLERSPDGFTFTQIALVFANGGSGRNQYSYTDDLKMVSANRVYYRLKQVDLDGSHTYTRAVALSLTARGAEMVITPNPVKRQRVVVQLAVPNATQASISIVDNSGRLLHHETRQVAAGGSTIEINNPKLPAGSYLLTVTTTGQNLLQRFIID